MIYALFHMTQLLYVNAIPTILCYMFRPVEKALPLPPAIGCIQLQSLGLFPILKIVPFLGITFKALQT